MTDSLVSLISFVYELMPLKGVKIDCSSGYRNEMHIQFVLCLPVKALSSRKNLDCPGTPFGPFLEMQRKPVRSACRPSDQGRGTEELASRGVLSRFARRYLPRDSSKFRSTTGQNRLPRLDESRKSCCFLQITMPPWLNL